MFLPIGDEPNPRQTPVVTYAIIALNVLLFLAFTLPRMDVPVTRNDPLLYEYLREIGRQTGVGGYHLLRSISEYDLFVFKWGFRPASPDILALLSSMFLHAGWMHLLGNMLFLWIFGDNVEARLGRIRFVGMYFATGFAATLFYSIFQSDSQIPLVGASGAISGVLGCYFLWFPRNRVRVVMVLFIFIQVILVPARFVLGFYLIVDNVLPFLFNQGGSGVAHGAHIGGFVAGLGFVRILQWIEDQKEKKIEKENQSVTANVTFEYDLQRGEWLGAYAQLEVMNEYQRMKLGDWSLLGLADGLTEVEAFGEALVVLQRFIGSRPTSKNLSLAHLRAGLIQLHGLKRPTAAYQHLLTVLDLDSPSSVDIEARQAIDTIENLPTSFR
ncbi:MAG: rhomboid family intramembrane serine protease [Myxococcota bacterium]|nr:rhomboid family intramembrane serine protease [Myxococcota bacterium]